MQNETPPLALDPPKGKIDTRQHLMWEKELLGLFISSHPLDDFRNYFASKTKPLKNYSKIDDGNQITIGGIVIGLRQIYTRNNDPMAFAQIETLDGDVEVIVFPRTFEKDKAIWALDNVLEITGKINAKDREGRLVDELKLMADSAKLINHETAKHFPPPAQTIEGVQDKSSDSKFPQP
jgi:DNA polymerase-3 subunit alpha